MMRQCFSLNGREDTLLPIADRQIDITREIGVREDARDEDESQ